MVSTTPASRPRSSRSSGSGTTPRSRTTGSPASRLPTVPTAPKPSAPTSHRGVSRRSLLLEQPRPTSELEEALAVVRGLLLLSPLRTWLERETFRPLTARHETIQFQLVQRRSKTVDPKHGIRSAQRSALRLG